MKEKFIEIPLLKLSSMDGLSEFNDDWIKGNSTQRIQVAAELDSVTGCYGVLIESNEMDPVLPAGMIALFNSQADKAEGRGNVFLFGIRGQAPLIRKVLKKDGSKDEGRARFTEEQTPRPVRKSFMTPTPLHIPGARISPIDDKTHEMILIKSLETSSQVQVVPTAKLLWMHPLVGVVNPNDHGAD